MPAHKSKAITIVAVLIILGAFWRLVRLINFNHYKFLFQQFPERAIFIRYLFSIISRIAAIACGVGILSRREFFRKFIVILSLFTILTIYWRHPIAAFQNAYEKAMQQRMADSGVSIKGGVYYTATPANRLPVIVALAAAYAVDLAFAGFLIYFFTRKKVKEEFYA